MKLKEKKRTFFEKNPIREVIGQIRFPRNMEIESGLPAVLQKEFSKDFPLVEIQESNAVSFKIGSKPDMDEIKRGKEPPVFNFISEDREMRISLTSSFIALTCINYSSWEDFFPVLESAFKKVAKIYSIPLVTRLGLRYRNLIDKVELEIPDEKWVNLINENIIGHLAPDCLFDGEIEEAQLTSSIGISQLKLDDFSLTLQTGFADNNNRLCFFIDADYYKEMNLKISDLNLKEEFEVLHGKSSSVFGGCIKQPLFEALKPIPQD